jgi:hypothetical protein
MSLVKAEAVRHRREPRRTNHARGMLPQRALMSDQTHPRLLTANLSSAGSRSSGADGFTAATPIAGRSLGPQTVLSGALRRFEVTTLSAPRCGAYYSTYKAPYRPS